MKTRHLTSFHANFWMLCLAGILAAPQLFAAQTNGIAATLQKGLFEEEANHNLAEAIQAYQSVLVSFDDNRKVAATALFRLAECYRKQGNTNEAIAQYQRLVRDFADDSNLAGLSRQTLAKLAPGAAQGSSPQTPIPRTKAEEDEIARILEMIRNSPDLINAPEPGTPWTPLHSAAMSGRISVAQFLLDNGADVNRKANGWTALHQAALAGHRAMVELLLSRGADVDGKDSSGQTALHVAAMRGFKSVAEVLIARDAGINLPDGTGATPLHHAVMTGGKAVAELLIARGADLEARDSQGNTPLHVAAGAGNQATVALLLEKKANINARNKKGAAPLLLAIAERKTDIASTLILGKADLTLAGGVTLSFANPNMRQQRGVLPLHVAVLAGNDSLVGLLLEHGADPNAKTQIDPSQSPQEISPQTPLEIAVNSDRGSTVELLLKAGAGPNQPNSSGASLLPDAIRVRSLEVVESLLNHKADPDVRDFNRNPCLILAVVRNDKALVRMLLDHKANTEAESQDHQTPLFMASVRRQKEIVQILLERGANPNAASTGETALNSVRQQIRNSPPATKIELEAIAEMLTQKGGVVEIPRLDRIQIRWTSGGFSRVIFLKSTNDWNQFSLFELVAVHYGYISANRELNDTWIPVDRNSLTAQGSFAFPDLARMTLRRPAAKENQWSNTAVDGQARLAKADCDDLALQWGDVLEIPELDHPISTTWAGLGAGQREKLVECLKRTVYITIKGDKTEVELLPEVPVVGTPFLVAQTDSVKPGGLRIISTNKSNATVPSWRPGSFAGGNHLVPQFMIWPVLSRSGLLRTSSDLTRVKVRRKQADGRVQEWVLDCSNTSAPPDLWLRSGDEIEVPEKAGSTS